MNSPDQQNRSFAAPNLAKGRLPSGELPPELYRAFLERSIPASTPLMIDEIVNENVEHRQANQAFSKWNKFIRELVEGGPEGAREIVGNVLKAERSGFVQIDHESAELVLQSQTADAVIKSSKSPVLKHVGLISKDGELWNNLEQLARIGVFGDCRPEGLTYLMRPEASTLINLSPGRIVELQIDIRILCDYRSVFIDPEMLNGYDYGEKVGCAWIVPGGIPWESIRVLGPWQFNIR